MKRTAFLRLILRAPLSLDKFVHDSGIKLDTGDYPNTWTCGADSSIGTAATASVF